MLLGVAAVVLLAFTAGPAAAAKSCGEKVIDDWYADGRVDGTYPPHCYDDAIESVPPDVRDYSSAVEDIQRALQARLRGDDPPPAQSDPTPGDDGPTGTGETGTTSTKTDTTAKPRTPDEGPEAAPPADDASADSVPVPLLVLAGLALLLIAAGSAGYVTRRLQARRLPPPRP